MRCHGPAPEVATIRNRPTGDQAHRCSMGLLRGNESFVSDSGKSVFQSRMIELELPPVGGSSGLSDMIETSRNLPFGKLTQHPDHHCLRGF